MFNHYAVGSRAKLNAVEPSLQAVALKASGVGLYEVFDPADAARYALLRRLAPAIRHDFLGALQVPGMMIGIIERRLRSVIPDLDSLRADLASVRSASQKALSASMNLMDWINPESEQTSDLNTAVLECVAMLAAGLRLRGFDVINEVAGVEAQLSRSAVRSVLSAALMALSDHAQAPAVLVLQARVLSDHIEVSVTLRSAEEAWTCLHALVDRPLQWHEAEVLAQAESVTWSRTRDGVRLTFKRAA